jgi:hypothetical protein
MLIKLNSEDATIFRQTLMDDPRMSRVVPANVRIR